MKKYLYRSLAAAFVLAACLLSAKISSADPLPASATPETAAQMPETAALQASAAIQETAEDEETQTQPPEPVFEEYDITLMAIGDNLLHMGIVYTGKQPDGSFNYDFLFEGISGFLDKADIKMINQETIFGGNNLGFHGFPKFNSPIEVSDAIAKAGFNVVLQATNHTADQEISGMQNCLDVWKTHPEVLVSGLHEPYADDSAESRIPLLEINDRTFAVLNYTYGPNIGTAPKDISDRLNLLCAVDENSRLIDFTTLNPQVLDDIAEADKLADIVIVAPHWGTEYTEVPSQYQQTFAKQMTEAGADVIIGTHPHVVQPVELIEAENGNRAICYYSLGNYVSTQKNGLSMLEGLAWVTFHVSENDISIAEENTGVIPLVCHYSSGPVRLQQVYTLEEYTEELALSHGIIPYGGIQFHLSDLQQWSDEILGSHVLTTDSISQPHCALPK